MSPTDLSARLIATLTCFVMGLGVAYGAMRVGGRLWQRFHLAFGPDGLRPISFIATAILFLPFLVSDLQKMLLLGFSLLFGVPVEFLQRSATALSQPEALGGGVTWAASLLNAFAAITGDYSRTLLSHAWSNSYPLLKSILFLLVWMLLGQLLKFSICQQGEKNVYGKGGDARSNFEVFSKKFRSWHPGMALCLILLSGLYLTLASIAGIAELNEKPSSNSLDISSDGLRKQLTTLQLTEERLVSLHPPDLLRATPQSVQLLLDLEKAAVPPSSPMLKLQDVDATSTPVSTTAPGQAVVTPVLPSEELLQHAQRVTNGREHIASLWDIRRRRVLKEAQTALDEVHQRFAVTSPPMSYQERAKYFRDILLWYQNRASRLDHELTECASSIRAADQLLSDWATQAVRTLSVAEAVPSRFDTAYQQAVAKCSASSQPPLPMPPESRLSVIFLPMSWIRESKSVSLALIVGMIGVGLLGSVVSSFIRSKGGQRENQKLPELTGVILRGLSAAVVVFLMVQGGLSIFFTNQEQPNPNPYVVLLLCLVAAVFSEDAWAYARKRFASYVGDDTRSPGQSPPPASSKEHP